MEIFFELSFILGNIVFITFWGLYFVDPSNVRQAGKIDPINDAWVHGTDTSLFWLDLLFVSSHHIRWSKRKLFFVVLSLVALYSAMCRYYFHLKGSHVYGFMGKMNEMQLVGFFVSIGVFFTLLDLVFYRLICCDHEEFKEE